jgi:hypothetical protein
MPVYRYFTEDLMTGAFLDELPGLYGTYLSSNMSQPGDWTGTTRMDSDFRTAQEILDVTMPGRTILWCERNNQLIWGGILWSRTFASQGRTMQFQARTFDAYLAKRFCTVDTTIGPDYRVNIAREAFRQSFELGTYAPLGVLDLPAAVATDGGATYTKTLLGVDNNQWQDILNEQVRAGVEYRIRYFKDALGARHAALDLGRWDLGGTWMLGVPADSGSSRMVFQYPGEIARYWWPESSADAANVLYGVGKSNDASTPRATMTNTDNLTSGYPRMERRVSYSEIESTAALTQTLLAVRDVVAPPMVNPTFALQLGPDTQDAEFGQWTLGDFFDFALNDPWRFPSVRTGSTRVTGWALTPGSSEGPETVAVTTTDFNAQILDAGQ